jgi:hypothetical protein
MMREVIIGGLLVVAVVILIRVIISTPVGHRMIEKFQSGSGGGSLLNNTTECPADAQMYMYEGTAYCCSGIINPDADTLKQSCRLLTVGSKSSIPSTFCSLGPPRKKDRDQVSVSNCLELKSGLMAAEGASFCPTSMPNYCQGGTNGRCCRGPTNPNYTDCADSQPHCDRLPTGENPLKNPTSCEYIKLTEDDTASCPTGYQPTQIVGHGQLDGYHVYGCTNMTQTCFSDDLISRLKADGKETGHLTRCATVVSS